MIDTIDCTHFLVVNKNTFVFLNPDHPYEYDRAYNQLLQECPSFSSDPINGETYIFRKMEGKKVPYTSLLQFIAHTYDEKLGYPYEVNGRVYRTNLVKIYEKNKADFVELITRVLSYYPKEFERKPYDELDTPKFKEPPVKIILQSAEKYREKFDKLAIKYMKNNGGKK